MSLTLERLVKSFDSTNLRLDASTADIRKLCKDAVKHKFASVMIYPNSVIDAKNFLITQEKNDVKIGTVIGFPSGRFSTASKVAEIREAAFLAKEVDVVIDYAALNEGYFNNVAHELTALREVSSEYKLLLKIIVETCYLNESNKLLALKLCEDAGVDFIKTSTGFGSAGAQVSDIELWASNRTTNIEIKASGGVKTLADAVKFLNAGATRLGTSNAVQITEEFLGLKSTGPVGSY